MTEEQSVTRPQRQGTKPPLEMSEDDANQQARYIVKQRSALIESFFHLGYGYL